MEHRGKWLDLERLGAVRGANILLVEDNQINQLVAGDLLEQAGLNVDIAFDGADGVEKVFHGHYDLVLMDIQMPVMDGLEATRKIRQDGRFADLPIVAMTANAMLNDVKKSAQAGMNDHLGKPFQPDLVIRYPSRADQTG